MITRNDYMQGHATCQEYYAEIARESGIDYSNANIMPRVCRAIESGDVHLNSIALTCWDTRAIFTRERITPALKARGDNYSLAGGVCTHKAAARVAYDRLKGKGKE